jgi:hypothetical protein
MFGLNKVFGLVTGIALAAGLSAANATVIDFTSAGTGTSGSLFKGAVTWTLTSNGTLNNSQAFDGNPTPVGTPLSFQTDGYGVGDDEISTSSRITQYIDLTFSAPTLIDAIYFLDLFVARNIQTAEVGLASIDGGAPIALMATDIAGSGTAGFVSALFAPVLATVIRFTVFDTNDLLGVADGALAGVGIAPVPVPAAGLMLLGGLGGLAALRRRRKTA